MLKISQELLYLETWNFVHMTSMTGCIVGKKTRAMGPGPLELSPFVVLAICVWVNIYFVSKISQELLYLQSLNFVHMTSMTSCIVGKKIGVMGPGPQSYFPLLFCLFLWDFSRTTISRILKFCTHDKYDLLYCRKENKVCGARSLLVISLCCSGYLCVSKHLFCVKDFSITTVPRILKFCTHDKYD